MNKKMKRTALTLVELIIVVAILGIMAAVVIPTFQGHVSQARASASKDSLRTLRSQIELYTMEHNGIPPGYANGGAVGTEILELQFTATTTVDGAVSPATVPAGVYQYGPYVKKLPDNPYNSLSDIAYVAEATPFSTAADDSTGWLYKKETGEIRLNSTGNDDDGVAYTTY